VGKGGGTFEELQCNGAWGSSRKKARILLLALSSFPPWYRPWSWTPCAGRVFSLEWGKKAGLAVVVMKDERVVGEAEEPQKLVNSCWQKVGWEQRVKQIQQGLEVFLGT